MGLRQRFEHRKRWHSACVMQDKIFVVGGKNNTHDQFVSEVGCYDPFSDNWSIVGDTNKKTHSLSLVAI